jgi:transposase
MGKRSEFRLDQKAAQLLEMAERSSKDGWTRMRYQGVRLYGSGYGLSEVKAITGCSTRRLLSWCQTYRRDGVQGLVDKRRGGNAAKLTADQIEHLQTLMSRYTPDQKYGQGNTVGGQFWTVADVRRLVKEECAVEYKSTTSYRTLMGKCELSYQKTQAVYKSRSAQKVAEFEEALEKN